MGWGITELVLSRSGQHTLDPASLDRVFFLLCVPITLSWGGIGCWFDVTQRRLPNWWLLTGALGLAVGFGAAFQRAAATSGDPATIVSSVGAGAGLWCGAYLLAFLLDPRSIGAGDVKLAAILGGSVGMAAGDAVAAVVFIGAAIVLAAGLTLLMAGSIAGKSRVNRRKAIMASIPESVPHGPAMLLAAGIVCGLSGGWVSGV